jgi:eukaryotic-like serine/threonine-protein kinase
MGVVYLGIAEGIGGFERLAAIKMLNPEHREREQYVHMFLDEARIGARVQHPNLVSVQEIGEHEGELFIAMDYVHGETLAKIIKRHDDLRRPLPLSFISEVGICVADALHAVHRSGVIHGDISPQNILVGYDGIVRVTDFGISHTADNMFQQQSVLRGKIGYLAPEQLLGAKQEAWSDLYSLGIVLWETCTSMRLFPSDVAPQIAVAHRLATFDKIDGPDKHRPDLPAELVAIVQKALASDPKHRFQDARTMGSALRSFQIEHCPSVCSDRFEEFMHELFADRIAKRRLDSLLPDDELSEVYHAAALSNAGSLYDQPPPEVQVAPVDEPIVAAPAPLAEPLLTPVLTSDLTHHAEPITGVYTIRRNRKWIPLVVSFVFTAAILALAGIPTREKAPEPPPAKVVVAKKPEAPKPKHRHRAKRVRTPLIKQRKVPLLFEADDL